MENRLGNKIASLRKTNNLSQKDLAKKINVSNKTISKWECGNGKPDIEVIQKISEIFNISVDELLSESHQKQNDIVDNKKKASNKIKISIISTVSSALLILAVILSILFIPRTPAINDSKILNLDAEQSLLTTTVSNETEKISLINSISVPLTNKWKLYDEINCSQEITSKTVFLNYGDNTFYILVENNAGKQKLYTVIIRRKPMYQITFDCGEHYLDVDRFFSVNVEEDSCLEEPTFIPKKNGYYFGNWSFDFSKPITSDNLIVATYFPNINTLIFDGNTSTSGMMENISIKTNETISLPDNLYSKDYYSFIGWSTSSNGSVEYNNKDSFKMNENSKQVLYAIWNPIQYDITYILNDGLLETDLISYNIEETILLPTPSMNGATFAGWYTDKSFSNARLEEIKQGSYGDITLYAKWEYINYAITYVMNGGTNNALNPREYTILNKNLDLYDAERDGYSFTGWYTSPYSNYSKINFINTQLCKNQTIYARWTPIEYIINYNTNDGTLETTKSCFTVESEIMLDSPTKEGYNFVGWFNNELCSGNPISIIQKGTIGNLELFAKWVPINYTISYELNEGENHPSNPLTYNIEGNDIVLENPSRSGCEFLGWYTDSTFDNQIYSIKTSILEDITIYAKWKILTYNITYNLNGGSSTSLRKTYNVTNSFTLAIPLLNGAVFDGWYTDSDYTIKIDKIEKGTIGDLELFAKWNYTTYYITYETNNGSFANDYVTQYNILDETIILETPIRDGYKFLGWYTDSRCCENKINTIEVTSCSNYTIYAKWINNNHIGISTQEELKNIGGKDSENYYILLNDITITESWYGISGFVSTLDGDGYSIKNLNNYHLFWNITNATIKNLNIENCNISITDTSWDSDSYGILAKKATSSTINNCSISGTLSVSKAHDWLDVGGFIGIANSTTISNCNANITLVATTSGESSALYAGGIVGSAIESNILNCAVQCNMTLRAVDSLTVGGVIGSKSGGKCENCTANGEIGGSASYVEKGEIIGSE